MRKHCLALALVVATVVAPPAMADPGCSAAPSAGGEWASYGRDLTGQRNQPQETELAGDNLQLAFASSVAGAGASGTLQSTPIITGGCIFVGTTDGTVIASDASTGALVWKATPLDGASYYGLTVADGAVFGISSTNDNSAFALDQDTGEVLWTTGQLETGGSSTTSSAIVFDGLLFAPTSGPDLTNDPHPSYSILDAATGAVLKKVYPIPDEDYAEGYAGGGIWTTAVVDEATRHLFAGTANPNSYRFEHAHTNSIVKIDMDRSSSTFGEIVGNYKGNIDQYVEGLDQQPVCQSPVTDLQPIGYSVFCTQLDIDFGASPNLWTDADGQTIVGNFQKSGVYHAVYADTMEPKWASIVSGPIAPGNISTPAVDATSVYVAASPGQLISLDRETGATNWAVPIGTYHYAPPVSVANGVVYTMGTASTLQAYDAASGAPVAVESVGTDAGDTCTTLGGGIAIANHTLYAVCDTGGTGGAWVVAYEAAS